MAAAAAALAPTISVMPANSLTKLDGGGKTASPPSDADRFLSTAGDGEISLELERNSEAWTGKAGGPPVDPNSTKEWAEPVAGAVT